MFSDQSPLLTMIPFFEISLAVHKNPTVPGQALVGPLSWRRPRSEVDLRGLEVDLLRSDASSYADLRGG